MTHRLREALWTMLSERYVVEPNVRGDYNGLTVSLDVLKAEAEALRSFNEELGAFSAGMATLPSDEVTLIAVVGARQRLKAFGKNNANLCGSEVAEEGGIQVVRAKTHVVVPLATRLRPLAN